jgi:hypothetical protein
MEKRYKVTFEFKNRHGKWNTDDMSNNGKGFSENEAQRVIEQLKYDGVCEKKNLRMEEI